MKEDIHKYHHWPYMTTPRLVLTHYPAFHRIPGCEMKMNGVSGMRASLRAGTISDSNI